MWEKHGDDVSGCALIADIDECAEEEARCSDAQYCVNKPGSFSCRGTQYGPVSSVSPCVRCVAVSCVTLCGHASCVALYGHMSDEPVCGHVSNGTCAGL